ncbi:MAG: hypothetical protein ACLQOZ_03690, partial [Acidimicrobiales bacterium]
GDLLAFRQGQRRAWHGGVSISRCRSEAPVIMTGTVHRLMELTVAFPPSNGPSAESASDNDYN